MRPSQRNFTLISNTSFTCENDGSLSNGILPLSISLSVARAQWLWLNAPAAAHAVLRNSHKARIALTLFSRHNHSFSAHGGQPDTKVTDLKTLGLGRSVARTRLMRLSVIAFLTDIWDSVISPHCPVTTQTDDKQ
ncbi:hypothetical protein B0I72DRAFT_161442 [Yarrowia lipolytica]|nr:hypothetical protein B0I72DRAFT_161442 [Yarrowia lipolytica]